MQERSTLLAIERCQSQTILAVCDHHPSKIRI